MRRALAVFASISLGIGTIALASPAQAQIKNAQCEEDSSEAVSMTYPPGALDPVALVVSLPGIGGSASSCTTFEWTSADAPDVTVEWSNDGGGTRTPVAAGESLTLDFQNGTVDLGVFATPSASDITFTLTFSGGNFTNEFVVTVAAGGGGGGGGDDSGSSGVAGQTPAPASVIQQFGLPASGNCEDGATEAMNWSGIGMDGWGISWAQWMNEGAGGAVCTRTVMYDTSTAKWTVN